jgi:succinate dehydrogenase/fumarate reductase flavoprotein subunit
MNINLQSMFSTNTIAKNTINQHNSPFVKDKTSHMDELHISDDAKKILNQKNTNVVDNENTLQEQIEKLQELLEKLEKKLLKASDEEKIVIMDQIASIFTQLMSLIEAVDSE